MHQNTAPAADKPANENECGPSLAVDDEPMVWYVLRDLKRHNAKKPGHIYLSDNNVEVFYPKRWEYAIVKGKRKRIQAPAVAGLLFAHSRKTPLSELLRVMPTLQFIYMRGGYQKLMTVRDAEMNNFIKAVEGAKDVIYHNADELSSISIGQTVKITGGPLDGVEGRIVNVRGSHKKRIVVSIPNFIAAVVEVTSGELNVLK